MKETIANESPKAPHIVERPGSKDFLPAIEIGRMDDKVRSVVTAIMQANDINSEAYKLRQGVGAFLQGSSEDYLLIEFWKGGPEDHKRFVGYLKGKLGI